MKRNIFRISMFCLIFGISIVMMPMTAHAARNSGRLREYIEETVDSALEESAEIVEDSISYSEIENSESNVGTSDSINSYGKMKNRNIESESRENKRNNDKVNGRNVTQKEIATEKRQKKTTKAATVKEPTTVKKNVVEIKQDLPTKSITEIPVIGLGMLNISALQRVSNNTDLDDVQENTYTTIDTSRKNNVDEKDSFMAKVVLIVIVVIVVFTIGFCFKRNREAEMLFN